MKKIFFAFIALVLIPLTGIAQQEIMYILKDGVVVGQYNVETEIDSIIFYNPEMQNDKVLTDARDGTVYNTVKIGNQVWMAENLRFLPAVTSPNIESETEPCYYVYDYNGTNLSAAKQSANYGAYGVLYNWPAAQTVCPTGWHLPSKAEFDAFIDELGGLDVAGHKLRETGTTHWLIPNSGATNSSEFTAVGAGMYIDNENKFGYLKSIAGFWTSTQITQHEWPSAYSYFLASSVAQVTGSDETGRLNGLSVRCVKDNGSQTPDEYTITLHVVPEAGGHAVAEGKIETGASILLDAIPAEGYKFVNWTGDTQFLSNTTSATLLFTMPAQNVSFTANFEDTSYIGDFESFTDTRDGNVYKTVAIGYQYWMAENLKYLPEVIGPTTGSRQTPYYYVYGYDGTDKQQAKASDNYKTYGVLYNWKAIMNGSPGSKANPSGIQGVCPDGWHLPSEAEWVELTDYLDGDAAAGNKLKEAGREHWKQYNNDATNETGFTALPGGDRSVNKYFKDIGSHGNWWSASEATFPTAISFSMNNSYGYVSKNNTDEEVGFSVRCVKNERAQPTHFKLLANLSPKRGGTVSGTGIHKFGSSVTITAIPDAGFEFLYWTGEDMQLVYSPTSPSVTFPMPIKDVNLTANFKLQSTASAATFTDSRDGAVYKSVEIGDQTWMAENLKYLPKVYAPSAGYNPGVGGEAKGYYYVQGYYGTDVEEAKSTGDYQTYGVLYNWRAAMNGAGSSSRIPSEVQGLCPDGWHLPSDGEWAQLIDFIGGTENSGTKLKADVGWGDRANGSNAVGFAALPAGYRDISGHFYDGGYWWSTTESEGKFHSWALRILFEGPDGQNVTTDFFGKEHGYAIRCVKDQ